MEPFGVIASGTDLESLAVTFGNSLLQSDLDRIDQNVTAPVDDNISNPPVSFNYIIKSDELQNESIETVSGTPHNNQPENDPASDTLEVKAARGRFVKSKHKRGWNEHCSECNMWFPSLRALQNHRSRKHMVNCINCDRRFGSTEDLKGHKCNVSTQSDSKTDIQLLTIPTEISQVPTVVEPSMPHFLTKDYCSQCSMWYTSDRPCKKHQERNNLISCSECEATFASSDEQQNHQLVCPATQKFTCTECGDTIIGTRTFNSHMTIHQYKDAESYKNRKFKCTICNLYFATLINLSTHRKQKHYKSNEFQCTICNSYFALSVKARGHVKNVHKLTEWKDYIKEVNETIGSSETMSTDELETSEAIERDSKLLSNKSDVEPTMTEESDSQYRELQLGDTNNLQECSSTDGNTVKDTNDEINKTVNKRSKKSSVKSPIPILPKPVAKLCIVDSTVQVTVEHGVPKTTPRKIDGKEFVCQDCGKVYYKLSSYNTHRIGKHAYVCPKCQSRFSSKANYESHLELVCGSPKPQPIPRLRPSELYQRAIQANKTTSILPKAAMSMDKSLISQCSSTSSNIGTTPVLQQFTSSDTLPQLFASNSIPVVSNIIPQFVAAGPNAAPSFLATALPQTLSVISNPPIISLPSTSVINPIINISTSSVFVPSTSSVQTQLILPVNNIQTPTLQTEDIVNANLSVQLVLNTTGNNQKPEDINSSYTCITAEANGKQPSSDDSMEHKTVNDKIVSEIKIIDIHSIKTEPSDSKKLGIGKKKKLLQCHICYKSNFTQYDSLYRHIRRHGQHPEAECAVCQKKFWQNSHLENHMNSHTQVKPFTCPLCSRKFAEKSTCRRHLRTMHNFTTDDARLLMKDIQPYKPNMNESDIINESDANKSDVEDGGVTPEYKSDSNALDFKSTMELDRERNETSSQNEDNTTDNLKKRKKLTNSNTDTIMLETDEHMTDGYGNESSKYVTAAMPESASPKQVKPFSCHLCQKTFVEKSTVRRHLRNMHNFTPEQAIVQMKGIQPDFSNAIEVGLEGTNLIKLDNKEHIKGIKHVAVKHKLTAEAEKHKLPEVDSIISVYKQDESISNFMMSAMEYEESKSTSESEMCSNPNVTNSEDDEDDSNNTANEPVSTSNYTDNIAISQKSSEYVQDVKSKTTYSASLGVSVSPGKQIMCPVCNRCYADKSTCRRHMRTIHKLSLEAAREKLRDFETDNDIPASNIQSGDVTSASMQQLNTNTEAPLQLNKDENAYINRTVDNSTSVIPVVKVEYNHEESINSFTRSGIHEEKKSVDCVTNIKDEINETIRVMDNTEENEIKTNKPAVDIIGKEYVSYRGISVDNYTDIANSFKEECINKISASPQPEDMLEARNINTSISDESSTNTRVVGVEIKSEPVDNSMYGESNTESLSSVTLNIRAANMEIKSEPNDCDMYGATHTALESLNARALDMDIKSEPVDSNFYGETSTAHSSSEKLNTRAEGMVIESEPVDISMYGETSASRSLPKTLTTTETINSDCITSAHLPKSECTESLFTVSSDQRLSSECPLCGKVLRDSSSRAKHMKRHSEHLRFKCIICNEIFTQVKQVLSHVKTHTVKGYRCALCSLYLKDKHTARRHQRRIHGLESGIDDLESNIIPSDGKISTLDLDSDFTSYYTIIDLLKGTEISSFSDSSNLFGLSAEELLGTKSGDLQQDESEQLKVFSENSCDANLVKPPTGLDTAVDMSFNNSVRINELAEPRTLDVYQNEFQKEINNDQPCLKYVDFTRQNNDTNVEPVVKKEVDDHNRYIATSSSPLKIKFKRNCLEEKSDTNDYSLNTGSSNSLNRVVPRKRIKMDQEGTKPSTASQENINQQNNEMFIETENVKNGKPPEMDMVLHETYSDSDNTVDLDYNDIKGNLDSSETFKKERMKLNKQTFASSSASASNNLKPDVGVLDEALMKVFDSINIPDILPMHSMTPTSLPQTDPIFHDDAEFSEDEKDKSKNETNPTKRQRIKCHDCNKLYASYKSYKGHRKLKHPLTCDTCHMKFADELLFTAHVKTHMDSPRGEPRSYDCPVCGKTFKDGSSRAKHVRLHTGEKPYACELCSKRFTQAGHLQSHMRKHNHEKPFPCRMCGRYFTEKSSVKRHIRKMHFNLYNKKCDICGTISKTREEHQQHWRTHKLDSYKCSTCSKEFPDSKRLKLHMYYIHTQRENMEFPDIFPAKFKCNVCSKNLYTTKGLKNHMKFHSKEHSKSVYKCGFCKRVFLSVEKLERHMAFHAHKGLGCVTCNKTFNNHSTYTSHKKRHLIEYIQSFEEKHHIDLTDALQVKDNQTATGECLENRIENENTSNIIEENINQIKNEEVNQKQIDEAGRNIENQGTADDLYCQKKIINELVKETGLKIVVTQTSLNYVFSRADSILEKTLGKTQRHIDKQTDAENTIINSAAETKTTIIQDVSKPETKVIQPACPQTPSLLSPYLKTITVYKCSYCKVFMASRSHLNNHVMATHRQKHVKCLQCSGRFSNPKMLKAHIARVHQSRAKHKCSFCDREFRDSHMLKNHIRGKHNGDYPHVCTVCGKGFLVRYKLQHHMEVHGTQHECPKCHTKFVHQKSYDEHMRANCIGHRKRRLFGQQLMKYGDGGSDRLACTVCGQAFLYKELLLVHLQDEHPDDEIMDILQHVGNDASVDGRNSAEGVNESAEDSKIISDGNYGSNTDLTSEISSSAVKIEIAE